MYELTTYENELAAALLIYLCFEDGDLFPGDLSPS